MGTVGSPRLGEVLNWSESPSPELRHQSGFQLSQHALRKNQSRETSFVHQVSLVSEVIRRCILCGSSCNLHKVQKNSRLGDRIVSMNVMIEAALEDSPS